MKKITSSSEIWHGVREEESCNQDVPCKQLAQKARKVGEEVSPHWRLQSYRWQRQQSKSKKIYLNFNKVGRSVVSSYHKSELHCCLSVEFRVIPSSGATMKSTQLSDSELVQLKANKKGENKKSVTFFKSLPKHDIKGYMWIYVTLWQWADVCINK